MTNEPTGLPPGLNIRVHLTRMDEARIARRTAELFWEMWREKNRKIIGWKLGRLRVNVSWRK